MTVEIRDIREEENASSEMYKLIRGIANDISSVREDCRSVMEDWRWLSERLRLYMRIYVVTMVALAAAVIATILRSFW